MRQTWIFQGNPQRFDIDGYLETNPPTTLWLVKTNPDQILLGDQVFLWRAIGGDDRSKGGIVAEAEVIELPQVQSDTPQAMQFWRNEEEEATIEPEMALRTRLRIIRIANRKEILRRDWLKEDPITSDLTIITRGVGTNFLVSEKHQKRLQALWTKTGTDWTYQECVAGLWVFQSTYGREVSKLAGSPVSEVAVKIGRAVSGVYNKVMNFRALDPRDERKGFSGGSESDSLVWNKFYDADAKRLRVEELEDEYARLWNADGEIIPVDLASAKEAVFEREVKAQQKRSLSELRSAYEESRQSMRRGKPKTTTAPATFFDRDPLVTAIAKIRAEFRCELPGCSHPTFLTNEGIPYCEVHHIEFLSVGGEDSPENVACLCPAHHREAHFGKEATVIRATLIAIRRENQPASLTLA